MLWLATLHLSASEHKREALRYNEDAQFTMYRLGHPTKHRAWPFLAGGLLLLILIAGSTVAFQHIFRSDTLLTQSPAVTRHISAGIQPTQVVGASLFTLNIPTGWKPVPPPAVAYAVYSWRGTKGDDAARRLDVYIDTIPTSLAVNRLLPVQSGGGQIMAAGTVSDNCVNFTDRSQADAATGAAPAKWGGVSFLCDTGNYGRDVVATGSTEGINTVTVVGTTKGSHRVLLLYTDNSANPDYTIFTAAVKSFRIL